jgi:hypothetical protein
MDIACLAHHVKWTWRVTPPLGEGLVAPTTNTDISMPDFHNLLLDPDKVVLNTSQNIVDNEEPKFYQQVLSGPNADVLYAAIEAEMDVLGITILGMWDTDLPKEWFIDSK